MNYFEDCAKVLGTRDEVPISREEALACVSEALDLKVEVIPKPWIDTIEFTVSFSTMKLFSLEKTPAHMLKYSYRNSEILSDFLQGILTTISTRCEQAIHEAFKKHKLDWLGRL